MINFVEILQSELKMDKSMAEKKVEFLLSRVNTSVIYDLAQKWNSLNQKLLICEVLVGRFNLNLLFLICEKLNGKELTVEKS